MVLEGGRGNAGVAVELWGEGRLRQQCNCVMTCLSLTLHWLYRRLVSLSIRNADINIDWRRLFSGMLKWLYFFEFEYVD